MTTAANPSASAGEWSVNAHRAHYDPLLDCLFAITRIHGSTQTRESLVAGLPLPDNLLTPELLPRAASRAGLSSRVLRLSLDQPERLVLPAIVLLNNQHCCVLLECDEHNALVRWPETSETAELIPLEELKARYAGILIHIRPRFRFEARSPQLTELREKHWFWGVVKNNQLLYRDAMLAALVVNLFALAVPFFSMNVYDRVVPNHATATLWFLGVGMLLVLGFDLVLKVVRGYILDVASKRIDIQVSALIMERVLGMKMAARPESVGSFASNLRAFEFIKDFIGSSSITALVDVPFAVVFLISLAWISPWFVLPPLLGGAVLLLYTWLTQEEMKTLMSLSQRAASQRNATLVESLVGIETIKAAGAEGVLQRKWERATIFLAQIGSKSKLLSSTTINVSGFIQQLVNIVTIMLGVYLLIEGQTTMGGIIAAGMLSSRAMGPLGAVAGIMLQYHNAHSALKGLETYMHLPVERPEEAQFVHRGQVKGDLEFRDVSFLYPGSDQKTLDGVNLKIRQGEKVGIIGRTGSGKTTLQKLIMGFYEPSEGQVLVDGMDIRQVDPADLRRSVGFVSQDNMLFYGTLRENIALGAPFATDNMVVQAADIAGVTEFANQNPKGFDMIVSERGESLSGGQRQAVCIARGLLNEPPVLLLDEPTSAMDFMAEDALKRRLKPVIAQKTLVLVTHRTSLLDLVDRLIVIEKGRILADGPKAEVMKALQSGALNGGARHGA